jgi:hypothetical protein
MSHNRIDFKLVRIGLRGGKTVIASPRETRDEAIFVLNRLNCFPAERGISFLAIVDDQQ